MPRLPRSTARRAVALAVLGVFAWLGLGLLGAFLVSRSRSMRIPTGLEVSGRPTVEVTARAIDGTTVRGWLVRSGSESERCVVLAAGIRGNRLSMLARAKWYLEHGWSILTVDLRGTGASDPARVTMGWNEALDLAAFFDLARSQGFRSIGVHGQSLGAAAVVFSASRCGLGAKWHFAVLESCYGELASAMQARLPWVPSLLTWPLAVSGEWLLDVRLEDLAPVRCIEHLKAPTLLVCGDRDTQVGEGATAHLLENCGASSKEVVVVPGAAHVDLWAHEDGAWSAELERFLAAR